MPPALIACSHGTGSPEGRAAVAGLVSAVAARRPDLDVRAAFVDVQEPDVNQVLDSLGGAPGRVVPLLLSAGYHVHVDLSEAVATHPAASLAGALGPDPRLAQLLADRLDEAGLRDDDHVVLAAAGSSDGRAVDDCRDLADALGRLIGRPSPAAYLSAAEPRLDAAVARAREAGGRVVVATYLLAPGFFADLVSRSGADVVTAPLLLPTEPPSRTLVDIVLDRYEG
ncbi:CbiX/SirB N-terminal domain-containing protein [Intrasporangium sp. DVR]|uniref:sirohydrochlorin chelatase n=1 Tax=Intrasporangium sp. DVR TaxID=3127867 RepID=UPI00313A6F4F